MQSFLCKSLGEFINECLKKHILLEEAVHAAAEDFMAVLRLAPVEEQTIRRGLKVRAQYGFSWWDSLIVAAALEFGYTSLYSEDLQDGQEIDRRLRIETLFH